MENYQKNARILNMDIVFMFVQFKLGEQWQMSIWTSFKFKIGVNLQIPCNPLLLNGMPNTLQP